MFEGAKGDERRLSSVVSEDGNAGMLRAESGMRNRPAGRKAILWELEDGYLQLFRKNCFEVDTLDL